MNEKTLQGILIAVIVLGSGYLVYSFVAPMTDMPEVVKTDGENIEITNCTIFSEEDFEERKDEYYSLERQILNLYPEFERVYSFGSYCELSNGQQIFSFAGHDDEKDHLGEQKISLVGKDGNLLRDTDDFFCKWVGGVAAPMVEYIANRKLIVSCKTVALATQQSTHEVDLDTFEYTVLTDEFIPFEESTDTSDWQTYRNEEFGFEVTYPKAYQIVSKTEFASYSSNELCLQSDNPSDYYLEFPCTLFFEIHNLDGKTLEEWLIEKDGYYNPEILQEFGAESEWRKIGNRSWFWVEYLDGSGLGELEFYTINDAKTVVIRATLNETVASVEDTVDIESPPEIILQILSTFRFIE